MSAPLDVAAQNQTLDALLGTGLPASFEVALFDGDPSAGGAELTSAGGYLRPVVDNDAVLFPNPAADGQKTSIPIAFANPSGNWSAVAQYWVLYDAADSTTAWWYGLLADELSVLATSTGISVRLSIYWNPEGIPG